MGRLTDRYCVVGVGETSYSKNSGKTTRGMGAEAVRNAILDAGLTAADVNGMLSYHGGDSTPAPEIAADLGIQLDFYMDCSGGGSSTGSTRRELKFRSRIFPSTWGRQASRFA